MEFKDIFLNPKEYYNDEFKKTTIYLHHTAGSCRPDYVVSGWNTDSNPDGSVRKIATPFVIGGMSTSNGDSTWDGVIVRCFPETKWAFHLGAQGTNGLFDKISIPIEICNYGPLVLSNTGQYMNYVHQPVPEDQVVRLDKPFRGYTYYHKYTDKQLESLRQLLFYLSSTYNIDLKSGIQEWINKEDLVLPSGLSPLQQQQWLNQNGFVGLNGKPLIEDGDLGANSQWALSCVGETAFEYNPLTMTGYPGIWLHSSIRKDKFDLPPQPNLVALLKSL